MKGGQQTHPEFRAAGLLAELVDGLAKGKKWETSLSRQMTDLEPEALQG